MTIDVRGSVHLSNDDIAAIEARIRAFDGRTGSQAVTRLSIVPIAINGLRWRAFALGIALMALRVVLADVSRRDWVDARTVPFAVATMLAAGLACRRVGELVTWHRVTCAMSSRVRLGKVRWER